MLPIRARDWCLGTLAQKDLKEGELVTSSKAVPRPKEHAEVGKEESELARIAD